MGGIQQLVVFTLGERVYALHLAAVLRIVRAVEIEPVPKAPSSVLGVVNVEGHIVPVFDLRRRFRLPEREVALDDQLILARTTRRRVALAVDAVSGVIERTEDEITKAGAILDGLDYIEGVAKLTGGLIFIHDLETFLSPAEAQRLEEALVAPSES